jgi:adenosylcobyric acid synthase
LGHPVSGYEIHHGRTDRGTGTPGWIELDDAYGAACEGATGDESRAAVLGTNLHGLFEEDGFRGAFLAGVAQRRGKDFVPAGVSFAAAREAQFDRLADLVEAHLDVGRLTGLIEQGAPCP